MNSSEICFAFTRCAKVTKKRKKCKGLMSKYM